MTVAAETAPTLSMRFRIARQPNGLYECKGVPVFFPVKRRGINWGKEEIAEAIKKTKASARTGYGRPKLQIQHWGSAPVIGRATNLYQTENGSAIANFSDMRAALANELLLGAFPQVSVSFGPDNRVIEHVALFGVGESHFPSPPYEYSADEATREAIKQDMKDDPSCRLFERMDGEDRSESTIMADSTQISPELMLALGEVVDEKLQPLTAAIAKIQASEALEESGETPPAKVEEEVIADAEEDVAEDEEEFEANADDSMEDEEEEAEEEFEADEEEKEEDDEKKDFSRTSSALEKSLKEQARLKVEAAKSKGKMKREDFEREMLKHMDAETYPNREKDAQEFSRTIMQATSPAMQKRLLNDFTRLVGGASAPSGRIPDAQTTKVPASVKQLYGSIKGIERQISLEDFARYKKSGSGNLGQFIRQNNIQPPAAK